MGRWTVMCCLAVSFGSLCAGIAAAGTMRPGIALDHRIGVVSFGEAEAAVTKALGRGVATHLDGHPVRFYSKVAIYVVYPAHRSIAAFVITRSTRYKTSSGVGVGSSLQQLRRGVGVRCYGKPVPDTCQHEAANINRPFTVFSIDVATKRVTEVAIVPGGD